MNETGLEGGKDAQWEALPSISHQVDRSTSRIAHCPFRLSFMTYLRDFTEGGEALTSSENTYWIVFKQCDSHFFVQIACPLLGRGQSIKGTGLSKFCL